MAFPVLRDALLECILKEMLEKGEITKAMADKVRKIIYEQCLFWMVDLISPGGPEVPDPDSES